MYLSTPPFSLLPDFSVFIMDYIQNERITYYLLVTLLSECKFHVISKIDTTSIRLYLNIEGDVIRANDNVILLK